MKNLKVILLMMGIALSLQSYAQEKGVAFSAGDQGYFYLRTLQHGDKLSLESNGALSPFKDGSSFMSAQKRASGTMWQFVPVAGQAGWYHLQSKGAGKSKCLEANNPVTGSAKGGSSFMDNCGNVTGQLWKLELVSSNNGDYIYRLRSYAHGNDRSLEGNKPDGSRTGITFMDTTQDVTGQKWRLVRVK
jgi:hypothetical protein